MIAVYRAAGARYNAPPLRRTRERYPMRILEEALTFDDVLLVPAYSEVLPREVSLASQLTREIRVNLPVVSAAMDTVTEARLAITIAQEGGIGIIHKNMSIDNQARQVDRVKKFESGVISDPITVSPDMTIRQVIELTRAKNISGVPVVLGTKVVGIVTHRDLRFETKLDAPVSSVMTPKERLITVRENAPKDEVLALLHKHRIEKVLVVAGDHELKGMITVKDFQKATEFPNACKDGVGSLRVGAAVGTAPDTLDRVAALREAGVDVVVVDTSHGHSRGVLETVARIKAKYPDMQVIGGNIVTAEAALDLVKHGADARQGGHRARDRSAPRASSPGVGVPQISAIARVAKALEGTRRAGDRRWRHPLFGRHRQGAGGRRALRDDRRHVRRHRGVARRRGAVPRRLLQGVSRHGIAGRDGPGAWLERPLFPGHDHGTGEAGAGRHRGPRARTRAAWSPSCISCRAACAPPWDTPAAAASKRCAPARNSCASPAPACARVTCTM